MQHKWFVSTMVALALVGLSPTHAGADPKPRLDVTLYCGPEVVQVSVAGNGAWTPAHDLGSTLVGVPIAFGEFSGVFTPTGGEPQAFTDPPFAKPNVPKTRNLIITCQYSVTGQDAGGTFTGNGSVTIMVPRVHL